MLFEEQHSVKLPDRTSVGRSGFSVVARQQMPGQSRPVITYLFKRVLIFTFMSIVHHNITLPEPLNIVHASDSSENLLIAQLQEGGSARTRAEKILYGRYTYLIRLGERQYRLDPELSASVYSDTIISLIQNIVSNRFQSRSSLKSYVHQIFMNKCVDEVRKKTTKKRAVNHNTREIDDLVNVLPDGARNAVQKLIDESVQNILYNLVNELGEKCRQLLMLFEDGYEDKEIAVQMNYNSADVVKTSRLRCMEKLRARFFATNR
jgi:RNA polymerase sigma factor, sigma-70 family